MIGLIARPLPMVAAALPTEDTYSAVFIKDNLLNNDYGRVVRTTNGNVGTHYIGFDLGAAPPAIDTAMLLWHNLRSTDTIRIRAGNTLADAQNGVGYDSGALSPVTGTSKRDVPAPAKFLLTMSASQTFRYWAFRVDVNTTNLPDGFISATRALLLKKAVFQIGPQRAEVSAFDMNQRIQMETGDERMSEDTLLIRPIAALDLSYAKESEMRDVLGQYTLGLGTSKPMLVCSDITDSVGLQDLMVFGRPENIVTLQSEIYDVWKFQARVRSLGP